MKTPTSRTIEDLRKHEAIANPVSIDALNWELNRDGSDYKQVLMAGPCAERFTDDSQALARAVHFLTTAFSDTDDPVLLVRGAGQYWKPRSSPTESCALSYFGDAVNSRYGDPVQRCLKPVSVLREAASSASETYRTLDAYRTGVYVCHEALDMTYENAMVRSKNSKKYVTSGHMLWLGNKATQMERCLANLPTNIQNPIALKLAHNADPDRAIGVMHQIRELSASEAPLVAIVRFGVDRDFTPLETMVKLASKRGLCVRWVCDPMHGNTRRVGGTKVRYLSEILGEIERFVTAINRAGEIPGGLHLEMGVNPIETVLEDPIQSKLGHAMRRPLVDPLLSPQQAARIWRHYSSTISLLGS